MKFITRHLSRCFIAGIVAMLPIGGLALTVWYLETTIAGAWPKQIKEYYFPGFGLLATAAIIYLVGLTVSTFLGRWLWSLVDTVLNKLPALGSFYQTLKQILGYGEGEDAIFQQVVLISSRDSDAEEVGLVTNRLTDEKGVEKLVIFIPGAPNPTLGRLLVTEASSIRLLDVPVNEALKALVSVGKTPIAIDKVRSG